MNLQLWINKLSLNLTKTNFVIFSNKTLCDSLAIICINYVLMIIWVYECKFIGVIIESKLSWKSQIARVKNNLLRCNIIMYEASFILSIATMRALYCSLFLPYLNYCSEVWGVTYTKITECSVVAQKKAIRMIYKASKPEDTNKLFF